MSELTSERILRIKTVLARTGLSRATLYRKIREGRFPRQVKISERGSGWYQSQVDSWVSQRDARRAGDGPAAAGPAEGR